MNLLRRLALTSESISDDSVRILVPLLRCYDAQLLNVVLSMRTAHSVWMMEADG